MSETPTRRTSSSLIRRVTSDFAFCMASSLVASIARYNFLSPSFGSFFGGRYVPRTVIPASENSHICASASYGEEIEKHVSVLVTL